MNFSAAFMLSLCGYIIFDTTSASPFTWLGDSDSIYSLLPSFGGGESSNDWFQQSSGNEDSVDSFTNWLQRLFGGGGSFSNYLGVPSFGVRSRSLFINEEDEHFPFGHFIITPRVPKNPISKKTKKPTKITKHPNLRGPLNPVIPVHWRNAILSKSSDTLMKPYREFKQGDGSPSVISEKLLSNITGGDRFLQLREWRKARRNQSYMMGISRTTRISRFGFIRTMEPYPRDLWMRKPRRRRRNKTKMSRSRKAYLLRMELRKNLTLASYVRGNRTEAVAFRNLTLNLLNRTYFPTASRKQTYIPRAFRDQTYFNGAFSNQTYIPRALINQTRHLT
ncbi:uncharacterized protein LOC103516347 [Diaphorina citri]|uniref:Uncharacterized protein LOC103516347 n=1 Tax=Diaphorina citri TaxID=121845 RepID=A0A3Q0J7Y5_DIACI|nr:uncharacterized protein LOC103516347 [Diaphorina citri]